MFNEIPQPLLQPSRLGDLLLPNRVVMAPLTRGRAINSGHAPNDLMREYYEQRATAGLIISEGTWVSADGQGWLGAPGIYNREQGAGWKAITAGFNGVQIQAGFVYLIQQFLHEPTNRRTDEYGGSIENRARFLFEVLEAVLEVWPRLGRSITPAGQSDHHLRAAQEPARCNDKGKSRNGLSRAKYRRSSEHRGCHKKVG
jgi:2,4-dienoyl-CoA reductase-like NADH-dependent reductase (Old Yellow Enzyme family)